MTAKLFCKTGQLKGASYTISDKATIGKDPGNTICLSLPTLSRRHASLFFNVKQGCYFLQDLGSQNGTRLDGIRVREQQRLGNLHIITLADSFDFIFQMIEDKSHDGSQEDKTVVESVAQSSLPFIHKQPPEENKTVVAAAIVPPSLPPIQK